jgi:hypothetical protein
MTASRWSKGQREGAPEGIRVVIRPVGGLGNQLFIYSAGRALANRMEGRLLVDVRAFRTSQQRLFELDSFDSKFDDVKGLLGHRSSAFFFLDKIIRRSVTSIRFPGKQQSLRLSSSFNYLELDVGAKKTAFLKGYLQSWKYFADFSDELRQQITRISSPSSWFEEQSAKIRRLDNSIAVHVRRGDYETKPSMGLTPERYYSRAIKIITRLNGESPIFLFSDSRKILEDPSFLSELRERIVCVSSPESSRPIETLNLISQCHHVVMSNSSFSWWGAWLGTNPDRTVIYPRPWLKGAYVDDRDLALPNWISLGMETDN